MPPPDVTASLLRDKSRATEFWLQASGASMGSRWMPSPRCRVEAVDRSPRRGEVWAFCIADGRVVVHRYLRRSGELHVFRGDARARRDQPVPKDWLIGRVVLVETAGRTWVPRRWHARALRAPALAFGLLRRLRR